MSNVSVVKELCEAEELFQEGWRKMISARVDFLRYLPKDWETNPENYPPDFQERVNALMKRIVAIDAPMEDLLRELSQLVKETASFIPGPEDTA